ncbi:MAG: nucleotidyltransferase family protein [Thermodesulfobacteriota bacterium]
MIAILLCAGFATRMYPLTKDLPKPLLEIGGRPVIEHLIGQILEFSGLDSIYIVTNDHFFRHFISWGEKIHETMNNKGVSLHIYNDGTESPEERLGAAGDLGFILDSISQNNGALVAAGDNIFRFPLKPYWEEFMRGDKSYVLALRKEDTEKLRRTGVLELGRDDRVTAFHEKPENPPSGFVCPAIYFLKPRSLDLAHEYLSSPDARDGIGYFISYLAKHDEIYAFRSKGEAIDIGTMESYERAKKMLSEEPLIK